jgi:hypothetical protein
MQALPITHSSANISSRSIFVSQVRLSCDNRDVLWKSLVEQLADDVTNWIHTYSAFIDSSILGNPVSLSGILNNEKEKQIIH